MPEFAVPGTHPVSVAGRAYLLDLASEQFAYETIPLLNPQLQNSSEQVSESSLNPEGLWRRSQASWHKGAGQSYLDKTDSDAARFRSSLGINVWEEGEISLLNDVSRQYTGATGKMIQMPIFGTYVIVGTNIVRITDLHAATPTVETIDINIAEPDVVPTSLAPFGIGVLVAVGSNGLHNVVTAAIPANHYSDLNADIIGMVAGRLMAAKGSIIYNVTASGAAPSALYSHPDSLFHWKGFAEAKGYIFIGGASLISDKSFVYKTTIKPDGTALDIPSVSAPLPEGELLTAIYGYLNFILIGTNRGVRFAVPDSEGNLEIGALVETAGSVECFEGQGPFVWFGWANYDGTHTGLGRCDLRTIVGGVAPAYATDLMALTQGRVVSVATEHFEDRRLFSVSGVGIYVETGNKVPTGTVDSGFITYDLPEEKEARFVDVRYRVLEGSDAISISNQTQSFNLLRTNTAADVQKRFSAGNLIGDMHELRHVFTRSTTNNTLGPVLTRHTLKSQVKVNMGAYWYLPLILASEEVTQAGNERHRNVVEEFTYLSNLAGAKETVDLKILDTTYSVTVEDVKFLPSHQSDDNKGFNGTMVVKVKVSV